MKFFRVYSLSNQSYREVINDKEEYKISSKFFLGGSFDESLKELLQKRHNLGVLYGELNSVSASYSFDISLMNVSHKYEMKMIPLSEVRKLKLRKINGEDLDVLNLYNTEFVLHILDTPNGRVIKELIDNKIDFTRKIALRCAEKNNKIKIFSIDILD